MGFSALSLGILTNSALASEPIPGSQKKVTGRGQRLGLSHNDVHLRHRDFFFGPIICIPRNYRPDHACTESGPLLRPEPANKCPNPWVCCGFPFPPHYPVLIGPRLFINFFLVLETDLLSSSARSSRLILARLSAGPTTHLASCSCLTVG